MLPHFSQARYDLITRHALALAGVLAAEIHVRESESAPLRRVASSFAPTALSPLPSEPQPDIDENRDTGLLDTERLRPFFDSVLSRPQLHETQLMPTSSGHFAERCDEPVAGPAIAHLVAGRIDAGGEVQGLIAFVLDHEARPPE